MDLGLKTFKVPVLISGGTNILLNFKINQTIPDIEFSSKEIDFGTISVGFVKIVYIRIENKNVVPTEWEYKPETKESKDEKKGAEVALVRRNEVFKIFPESGLLKPMQKQNLKIVFMPVTSNNFTQIIKFKLKSNDDFKEVICRGSSFTPKLEFDSLNLNVNTMLPYSVSPY